MIESLYLEFATLSWSLCRLGCRCEGTGPKGAGETPSAPVPAAALTLKKVVQIAILLSACSPAGEALALRGRVDGPPDEALRWSDFIRRKTRPRICTRNSGWHRERSSLTPEWGFFSVGIYTQCLNHGEMDCEGPVRIIRGRRFDDSSQYRFCTR